MTASSDLLFCEHPGANGNIASIAINRPHVINAWDLSMSIALSQQLTLWEKNPSIKAVILRGNGPRGFCSGGDLKAIYQAHQQGIPTAQIAIIFEAEYKLIHQISTYNKPFISLIHGATMGAGTGLALAAGLCLATQDTQLAMPENRIGLFPDVGAGHFLTRPQLGHLGYAIALCGLPLSAHDAQQFGLIRAVVKQISDFDRILAHWQKQPDALSYASFLQAAQAYAIPPQNNPPSPWQQHQKHIDAAFCHADLTQIKHALSRSHASPLEAQLHHALTYNCPQSLMLTLELLNHGAHHHDLGQQLSRDFQLAQYCLNGDDFYEGIRAQLIDKTHDPVWTACSQVPQLAKIFSSYPPLSGIHIPCAG